MCHHFLSCFLWMVRWEARTLQTLRAQLPFPLHQGCLGHPHKCQKLLLGSGRKPGASPRVTKACPYLPQGKEGRELKQFNPLRCARQAAECFMWQPVPWIYTVRRVRIYVSPICFTGLCHTVSAITWQQVNLPRSHVKWNISSGIQSGACLESRAKTIVLKWSKMPLSNLESFFLGHQEQTHLLSSVPWAKQQVSLTLILVPLWQEPGCATMAWQPAEAGALPIQQDGKVLRRPSQSDQSSVAQLSGVPALRRVRAGRAQHQSCPRRKSWGCRNWQQPLGCSSLVVLNIFCVTATKAVKRAPPQDSFCQEEGRGGHSLPNPTSWPKLLLLALFMFRAQGSSMRKEKGLLQLASSWCEGPDWTASKGCNKRGSKTSFEPSPQPFLHVNQENGATSASGCPACCPVGSWYGKSSDSVICLPCIFWSRNII